ncbi:MAG: IPT/TIG domain-containing protein [Myxococcota bacterium]
MLRRLLAPLLLVAACNAADPTLRVTPASGKQSGGEVVRIEGDGFADGGPVLVYLGGKAVKGVVIESPWLIRFTTPQSEEVGAMDVLLRFADGREARLEGGFTYEKQEGIVLQPRIGGGAPSSQPPPTP